MLPVASALIRCMTPDELSGLFEVFRAKRILVIGDVMLDRFLWGSVSRISPEAPVPVVEVERESVYPGGAANVARNLVPFAGEVRLLGLVGEDPDAEELAALIGEAGIAGGGLLRSGDRRTIVKTRVVARNQQVVRIDREDRRPPSSAEFACARNALEATLREVDAVIIEDYGKGFVTQALVDLIAALNADGRILVTVDPNPGNPLEWKGVGVVKPNRHEAFQAAGVPEHPITSPPDRDPRLMEIAGRLLERWDTRHVLITLGEHGMLLCSREAPPYHVPTRAREVFDVSGAGDTAIALATLALAAGAPAPVAADIANHASGIVVGKLGTATLTPEELAGSFREG